MGETGDGLEDAFSLIQVVNNMETFAPLIINTNSYCILCLRDDHHNDSAVKIEPDLPAHQQQPEISSLRSICRYLKININGVLDLCGLLEDVDKLGNFSVNLCKPCLSVVSKLTNLTTELELLQMKVDDSLRSFRDVLKDAEDDTERVAQFSGQLLTGQMEVSHGTFADELRREMIRKSDQRLRDLFPKVTVESQSTQQTIPRNSQENPSHPILSGQNTTPVTQDIVFIPKPRKKVKEKWIHKLTTCTMCLPPRSLKVREMKRHIIHTHLETLFISKKPPDLPLPDFKEYCEYVTQVEVISSKKQQNAEGNPCCQCGNCTNIYTNYRSLRYHLYADHKDILANKLVALMQTSTVEDIRAIQLPSSCFSKDDLWRCTTCGMEFKYESGLYKHKRQGKGCGGGGKLRSRKKNVSGPSSYKCWSCFTSFTSLSTLRRHIKRVHGGRSKDNGNDHQDQEIDAGLMVVEENSGSMEDYGEGQQEEVFEHNVIVPKMEGVGRFSMEGGGEAVPNGHHQEYLMVQEEHLQSEMFSENEEEMMIIPDNTKFCNG